MQRATQRRVSLSASNPCKSASNPCTPSLATAAKRCWSFTPGRSVAPAVLERASKVMALGNNFRALISHPDPHLSMQRLRSAPGQKQRIPRPPRIGMNPKAWQCADERAPCPAGTGLSGSSKRPRPNIRPRYPTYLGPWHSHRHSHPRYHGQPETQRAKQWPQGSTFLPSKVSRRASCAIRREVDSRLGKD